MAILKVGRQIDEILRSTTVGPIDLSNQKLMAFLNLPIDDGYSEGRTPNK